MAGGWDGGMVGWWDGGMAGWWDDEMAGWWDGGMVEKIWPEIRRDSGHYGDRG